MRYLKAAFMAGMVVAVITAFMLFSWLVIPLALGAVIFIAILDDNKPSE